MCLPEIPGLLADPHGSIVGARRRAAFFLLLFFAVQRKVTRASRETLWTLKLRLEAKSKIKGTPPQSSPALRAREEARALDPGVRRDDDTCQQKKTPAETDTTGVP